MRILKRMIIITEIYLITNTPEKSANVTQTQLLVSYIGQLKLKISDIT